jgi:NAD(P)-dependent dehydrogenase (short-subunit alcohol dehydrogenase family)
MAQETLNGKIAVVTGGARGIGYAIAERLLEEGASVAFCALRQSSVDAAVTSLSKGTAPARKVLGCAADVSKLADVRHFVQLILATFGGIDILINNAAIRTYLPVVDLDPADWDKMLAVNLSGAYYCTHEVLPILKRRGGGDIINISSLSSNTPFAGGAGYNASKAGLNALSEATMLDHRYHGVRVSEVMPGSTDTGFNGTPDRQTSPADWKVAPEDIAEAVVMILRMPRRTTVSRVDVKPAQPPRKAG